MTTARTLHLPPALVLNADFRPLSFAPLSLWPWQDAIRAIVSDTATPVKTYDILVRSPSTAIELPSVIALRQYVPQRREASLTRYTLFLRDRFRCSYCGSPDDLTIDHIVPRTLGGKTSFTNCCLACAPCNSRKGSLRLAAAGMTLLQPAYAPTQSQLDRIGRDFPPDHLHDDWRSCLYWDVPLER